MLYNDGKAGFLTVIIGPMFSEKSGELIKQCLLSQNYQNKTVRIYKPVIDDRYGEDEVVSRIGLRMPAYNISQEITPERSGPSWQTVKQLIWWPLMRHSSSRRVCWN